MVGMLFWLVMCHNDCFFVAAFIWLEFVFIGLVAVAYGFGGIFVV